MTRVSASQLLASSRRIASAVPVGSSVYSAFDYYGARHAYELQGTWLVAALQELGYREMSIRQILFRMVQNGELTARFQGGKKLYRPTAAVTPEVHAVSERIHRVEGNTWDGQWSMIQLAGAGDRQVRERLQDVFHLHGFAWIAPGVYIHPRDRLAGIRAGAKNLGIADAIEMFRARRVEPDDRAYVARHWDLVGLRKGYDKFLRQYAPLQRTVAKLPDDVAFVGGRPFTHRKGQPADSAHSSSLRQPPCGEHATTNAPT